MGNGVRLHEDAEVNYSQAAGFNAYQIIFDDNPGAEELERRMERLKEIYPDYRIMNGGESADYFTDSADMVASIHSLLEVYVIYSVILGIATLAAVFLAAQSTRKVTASQTSSIE